jgi:hypothetical protein
MGHFVLLPLFRFVAVLNMDGLPGLWMVYQIQWWKKVCLHAFSRQYDDKPIALWVRGLSMYVAVNSLTNGTGTWVEYPVRIGTAGAITGTRNSFVQLASGGFGIYYYQRVYQSGAFIYSWEYSYTTVLAGTSGWIHQTVHVSNANRRGVLGIDGLGYVFIAYTLDSNPLGFAQLQIMRGIDPVGTSFTVVQTITMDSSCTLVGINRRRAVAFSDGTSGILITCQNQRIFFLRSTGLSVEDPWLIQHVVTNAASFSAIDPTAHTSLGITQGNGAPHIVYKTIDQDNIQFIQSLDRLF